MDNKDNLQPRQSSADVSRMTSSSSNSDSWSFADLPPPNSNRPSPNRHTSLPRSIFGGNSIPPLHSSAGQDHARQLSDQRPLATLQPTQATQGQQYDSEGRIDPRLLPTAVKDVDDVTNPPSTSRARHGRAESTTLTTLSRLFAVQATTSPDISRSGSYAMPPRYPSSYTRSMYGDRAAALPDHLYSRGLLSGRHSDITVHAFGHEYKLHRLILDRAPFFASALSEPWLEANAKSMTVHPEDIDSSISQTAFELALKRLYGCCNLAEEEQDPVGLFCVG